MRVRRSSIVILSLSAIACGLSACEDQAANQRRELQAVVTSANETLREATLVVVDPNNEEQFQRARDQLNRVVSQLRSADTTGETGQEIAINTLLADAGQKLAAMYLAEVEQAQAVMRDDSSLARAHISSILRLDEFIQAADSIDVNDETAAIADARSGANSQLNQISSTLAQLDGPIGQLSSANRDDAERINMLRSDAEELVQMASELGPAEGFPQYEQALQMRREAGQIETQIARRELDLAYQYEPQHELAGSQAQQLQQYIDALDQARSKLSEIMDVMSNEVAQTSQRITALRSELDDRLAAIDAAISGPLESAYQEGLSTVDQALRGARSAKARLLQAQLLETQGRLHWAKSRALAEQIDVLNRVVAAGDAVGNTAAAQRTINEATAAHDQAIEMARQSYTEAQGALPGGNDPGIDALRRSLDLAIGTLGGQSMQDMRDAQPANTGAAMTSNSNSDGGFASPEAALAALKTIDPDRPETSMVMINAVHTTTPLQVQWIDAATAMNEKADELTRAIVQNLGQQVGNSMSQMGAASTPDFSTASIISQDAETAAIEADMLQPGMGQRFMVELERINDSWMITFDSLAQNNMPPGMTISDSLTLLRAMAAAFDELIDGLRNGEITTEQQLMTAMMNAMNSQ